MISRITGAVVVVLVALTGCGSDDATTEDPPAAADATTTSAAKDDSAPGSDDASGAIDAWDATAAQHRGKDGETFEYRCAPDGTVGGLWGTKTYTDDSSVCTAGVHAGLIDLADGGTVTIEIAPGEDSYTGSSAHGVNSNDYGPWGGSYTFVEE